MARAPKAPAPLAGAVCGLLGAMLFGASAPVAKAILPGFGALSLAGVLYLGAGLGLTGYRAGARLLAAGREGGERREARLGRRDLPLLAGIIITGGVIGPVAMLLGLARLSGVAASLLLNLEAVFTIAIAVLVCREHLGRREAIAAGAIIGGAAILAYRTGEIGGDLLGVLAIAGACLSWGIDNNLTQRLSLRDPAAIVQVKTLGAGALTTLLALAAGEPHPPPPTIAAALVLGMASYGASIVLDTHALRILGAAREAAFFATAPFVGALLAIPVLGERPAPPDLGAAAVMIAGVVVLLREAHAHLHTHEPLEHEHAHVHDEHHRHPHDGPITEPHAHWHRHEPITHDHPHVPDAHHRHRH